MPKKAERASAGAKPAEPTRATHTQPPPKPAPKNNGAKEKEPQEPLPESLKQALPVSKVIAKHVQALAAEFPQLDRELTASLQQGAITAARAFVVLHRLTSFIEDTLKKLTGEAEGDKEGIFSRYKRELLPKVFEHDGVTSVPLSEGFRVGIARNFRASIKKGQREAAYEWLVKNGLKDLITPTVNASSLSATARKMQEEENKELPEDLFNVHMMPTTSVTKT